MHDPFEILHGDFTADDRVNRKVGRDLYIFCKARN